MKLDKRFLLGLFTILFCIALAYNTVDNYIIHYNTVSEVLAEPTYEDIRVTGTLVDAPVNEDGRYHFQITDGIATMQVLYNDNLPSSFNIESEIVVHGKMGDDNMFRAHTVLTKCPSKFEA